MRLNYIIYFFLISRICIYGQSAQLTDFNDLLDALKSGKTVRIITDYSKCKLVTDSTENNAPEAIGGMNINTFEYFARGSVKNERAFISTSEAPLIFHPRYGHILNYVKIRIYEDNEIEITARYLDPKSYEIKMDETFFSTINNTRNDGGVTIFLK